MRERKEVEGRAGSPRDHTAEPLHSPEPALQPQHPHLEICIQDPDEGADTGVTRRLEHDEAPRTILSPKKRGATGGTVEPGEAPDLPPSILGPS